MTPVPARRRAAAMPSTSSVDARSVPSFSPTLVRCTAVRDVVNPRAPDRRADSARRLMAAMSSASAATRWSAPRSPIT